MHNTSDAPHAPTPQYPWPGPGPDAPLVPWAEWLRCWADAIHRASGGLPGLWLAEAVGALAEQARVLGATGPESHLSLAQAEQDRHEAWISALEQAAHEGGTRDCDAPEDQYDPNDPGVFGSLIGPDEHCLRAWIAPDEDRMN